MDEYEDASDADAAVTTLYRSHYAPMVRLATLLLRDPAVAEEVVQDAFVAIHRRWKGLRDPSHAVAYLRTSVVHGSHSVQRRRAVAARHPEDPLPDAPSAEHGALQSASADAVVRAVRLLPRRQREAIVLRYYAGLTESEIAATMKISNGAVKSHTFRAMATLRTVLEDWS